MIWWYGTFLVMTFAGVAMILRVVDPSWRRLYHPWILVGGLYLLYSLTPLSSPVIIQEQLSTLEAFLLVQLVGMLGLGFGTIAAHAVWSSNSVSRSTVRIKIESEALLQIATLAFTVLWLAAFQVFEGGLSRVVSQGYLWGESISGGEVIAYAIATYPLLALIIVGYFARGAAWDVVLAGTLFAILNVLGGHRNLMMMEVGGVLAMYSLREKRPGYGVLLVGGVVGFLFLMFVGVYRGLGVQGLPLLLAILKQDGLRVFDPSTQELGTSFHVFKIFRDTQGAGFAGWLPGESYIRAFLSIVPRQLWPDRPDAIATYFSNLYAPPGEGLGFSFNLEAYVSFGTPGVLLAMAALGFILTGIFINHCSRRLTMFGVSFYGTLLFASFNLNRIDSQTVLKIGALLAGSQYLVLRALSGHRHRTTRTTNNLQQPMTS